MKNGMHLQLKIVVVGARQVGKSALTVRYLTRRYIGEYKSHTDLSYRQIFSLDGSSVEVEIVDVSNHPDDTSVPLTRVKNSDACVIVYSIADRGSFRTAHEALISLRGNGIQRSLDKHTTAASDHVPIVLLGNKKDLDHLREVPTAEGRELARRYCCIFCEVSAAEAEMEPDITCIFKQLIREARVFKVQPNNCNSANSANNHNNNNNNNRQRKRSVFTINRMFGSLMGRNSMPPEMPSKKHGTVSNLAASMPDVAGSFKSVFKKRSV